MEGDQPGTGCWRDVALRINQIPQLRLGYFFVPLKGTMRKKYADGTKRYPKIYAAPSSEFANSINSIYVKTWGGIGDFVDGVKYVVTGKQRIKGFMLTHELQRIKGEDVRFRYSSLMQDDEGYYIYDGILEVGVLEGTHDRTTGHEAKKELAKLAKKRGWVAVA